MTKLNQIVAVTAGKKTRAATAINEIYHKLQKAELLKGIARTYRPKDDDGEKFPAERNAVKFKADDAIAQVRQVWGDLMDTVLTQDVANCNAQADIMVDGQVITAGVPVTHLLFLEKQLIDIRTFVSSLPVLDSGMTWAKDEATDSYATEPSETTKTKKIPRNHVKYEATKEHPAQVEVFSEDVIVGYWTTVNYSGAIPESRKKEILERVSLLQDAIKSAREEANSIDIADMEESKDIFNYIFGE